jgi:4-diphosphocytidyl-2-C-methyl-D-erythritol kinase
LAKSLSVRSFAKLNLFLDVICKRKDGYHNIETVFQSVNLHDELILELLPSGLRITCDDPSIPSDSTNLAAKAFFAIRDVLNYRGGISIQIRKKIPAGAGLGGGSSNAAAVLKGMNRLLDGQLPGQKMHELAGQLGADVPFFLSGGLAAGWGKGEKLLPLPSLPESHLVVALPVGVSISTAFMYRKVSAPECSAPPPETFSGCGERLKGFVEAVYPSVSLASNASVFHFLYNELEEAAFRYFPEVAFLKKAMLKSGALEALMSGSGSAVFGFAEGAKEAESIRQRLESGGGYRCFVVSTKTLVE